VSEEKTRIIPRSQAPGESAQTEPRRIGDKIVFFCPNGDRIVVPAKFAGKRGECSKCKVPVVIPSVGGAGPKQARGQTIVIAEPAAPEPEPSVDEPSVDESAGDESAAAVDAAELPLAAEAAAAEPAAGEGWNFPAEQDAAESSHAGLDLHVAGSTDQQVWDMPPPAVGEGQEHPAARLVARLWAERGHGGIVELHLAGGSVILPEWYEVNWSRGTHGLFAGQAADGTVTLTAVAWDTIEKIVVRQVQGLPDGMFEQA